MVAPARSPIDAYYDFAERLLRLGTPEGLDNDDLLGRLLLLGLVSGVEGYLRSVLTGLLRLCPICRGVAAEIPIPLGAFDYYSATELEYGLLDRSSLASEREVRSWVKKLWDIDTSESTTVTAALKEFDKVCHLRHSSVHAQGQLGSMSARSLGLAAGSGRQVIHVTFAGLQAAGGVCHTFVRAFNLWSWERAAERWHGKTVLCGLWRDDKSIFSSLMGLFWSVRDMNADPNPRSLYAALPFGYRLRASPAE